MRSNESTQSDLCDDYIVYQGVASGRITLCHKGICLSGDTDEISKLVDMLKKGGVPIGNMTSKVLLHRITKMTNPEYFI